MGSDRENAVKIFVSAGEASGDLHGSRMVRALRASEPRARVTCLGGALLREAGATVLVDNRELAVVGLFEVVRHLKVIYEAWRKIRSHIVEDRPDVIVLIDYPDFNFILARLARRVGIKVFYYISPQVWAWRSGRVRTLKRLVDAMAVILPFEPAFYERHHMKVQYVGHPLLDVLDAPDAPDAVGEGVEAPARENARARYRAENGGPLVGLLPGSRRSEIRLLLSLLLETARSLSVQIPDISFIIPVARTLDPAMIEAEAAKLNLPLRVISGDTYGVIRACDLILTASGTVTLEAAILGTPMIIVNRVSELSYALGRRLIQVDSIGLPNLIAGRRIIPELIQHEAQPERLAAEALAFLRHPERLDAQRRELAHIRGRLGRPGVAQRVADLVLATAVSPLPPVSARRS